jgi:hypothetical protein
MRLEEALGVRLLCQRDQNRSSSMDLHAAISGELAKPARPALTSCRASRTGAHVFDPKLEAALTRDRK